MQSDDQEKYHEHGEEQQHYTVPQFAAELGLDKNTLRKILKNEPGVIKWRSKKKRLMMRIPKSVAAKVRAKLLEGKDD